MAKYDTNDVKSVQKFLAGIKEQFEGINALLPEDAKAKLDYDAFTDNFFKANEGILANRDAIKQEKLKLSEEYTAYKEQMTAKWGSIDENIQNMYNEVVKERDELKAAMKDGKVDIDGINAKFAAEKQKLVEDFDKRLKEQTQDLATKAESLEAQSTKFKGLFFEKLKSEALTRELDRIKVNPEDRPLIMQANVGRAEIAEDDKGNHSVLFKTDKGDSVPIDKYWDEWSTAGHNQRYILAEDNSGGGASGAGVTQAISETAKLQKQLNDPTTPLHVKMALTAKLNEMN